MSGPKIHQLLLTRFNLRTAGVGYSEDQSADWLEGRFDLFARYCAPSVASQTEEDFDWLIFCDEHTPPETLDRIRAFDPRIRIALFVYRPATPEGASPAAPRPAQAGQAKVYGTLQIYPHVRPDAELVIATRLDNDDALSRHALRRVREHTDLFLETGNDQWIYNPVLGYKLHDPTLRLFPAAKQNSAFFTMFERKTADLRPRGPFGGNHSTMYQQYPTHHDIDARMWLMVIHDGNVINGIGARDKEIPLSALGDDFAIHLETPTAP